MASAPKKEFKLLWLADPLKDDSSYLEKAMFGARAVYFRGKMVLLFSESPGDRSWKGQSYEYDIWYGLLFPTEYEKQASIREEFPELVRHPVLPKWLYLPVNHPHFESKAVSLIELIGAEDSRFGIVPKLKKARKKKSSKKKK